MTYGWAILIIAVVLAALYSLGIFGNGLAGPRAQPNSCRVFRPNGVGTTSNINLEGVCNGELPEYVTNFVNSNGGGSSSSFSYVITGTTGFPAAFAAKTVVAWVYWTPGANNRYQIYASNGLSGARALGIWGNNALATLHVSCDISSTLTVSPDVWTFVGYSYDGSSNTIFYSNTNTQTISGTSGCWSNPASQFSYISPSTAQINTGTSFNGSIANIQIYSVALDANAIQSLYLEGIGGAPVEPQNLAAWWPLNGDVNDYSGNGNNGVPNNVIYTSSWTQGYTTP